ncbi:permease [Brevibacterium samyangense]
MAWYGVVSAMFFVYIGAAMAVAYGTRDALIGIALAIAAYTFINILLSKRALHTRASVAQFSRTILGNSGSIVATIIFATVAIYYAVFEGIIVAFAFQAMFGGPMWMWSLIVVLYSTPLVVGRVRNFLDKLNGWLMPVYWLGLVAAVVIAGVKYGFESTWLTQGPELALPFASGGPGWLATFAAYMGSWIMMMYTVDYAAMGQRKDAVFHSNYTFGWLFYTLAFGVNALIGIFLTFTIPGVEASETGIAGGLVGLMGIFGLLVVFVSQTRINTANYWLAFENLALFGRRALKIKAPTWAFAVVGAILIYLIMLLPITEYILLALAWQGIVVTAWVGIAVTHAILDKIGEHGNVQDEDYRAFNRPGIIAWVVATTVGLLVLNLAPSGATWGPIVTTVLGAVLYLALQPVFKEKTALKDAVSHGMEPIPSKPEAVAV